MAHKEFQDKFKELSLSLSEVEQKILCPKNYLSQFINGPRNLPNKWEKAIRDFLKGTKTLLDKLDEKPANPEILRPWIKLIEDYCKSIGKDPEQLIEDHKALKLQLAAQKLSSAKEVKVTDLTPNPPKSNYTVNTLSNWAEENRKKKLGL